MYGGDPDKQAEADLISGSLGIVAALALLAAAVVFIVWLWRVRWNAEMFCRGEHRFTRGWVLGCWLCPVVNLWYPKQVVDDVVAASDPRTDPLTPLRKNIPGTQLVWAWWLTWVAGLVHREHRANEVFSTARRSSATCGRTLYVLRLGAVHHRRGRARSDPDPADQRAPEHASVGAVVGRSATPHSGFQPPAR